MFMKAEDSRGQEGGQQQAAANGRPVGLLTSAFGLVRGGRVVGWWWLGGWLGCWFGK